MHAQGCTCVCVLAPMGDCAPWVNVCQCDSYTSLHSLLLCLYTPGYVQKSAQESPPPVHLTLTHLLGCSPACHIPKTCSDLQLTVLPQPPLH